MILINFQYQRDDISRKPINVPQPSLKRSTEHVPSGSFASGQKGENLNQILENAIKILPIPCCTQSPLTIAGMKEVIQKQEFKIQKNLLEIDEFQINTLERKPSSKTNPEEFMWHDSLNGHDCSSWKWNLSQKEHEEGSRDLQNYFAFID